MARDPLQAAVHLRPDGVCPIFPILPRDNAASCSRNRLPIQSFPRIDGFHHARWSRSGHPTHNGSIQRYSWFYVVYPFSASKPAPPARSPSRNWMVGSDNHDRSVLLRILVSVPSTENDGDAGEHV